MPLKMFASNEQASGRSDEPTGIAPMSATIIPPIAATTAACTIGCKPVPLLFGDANSLS